MCLHVPQPLMLADCHAGGYDLVVAAEDDVATIMTVESGKPLKES